MHVPLNLGVGLAIGNTWANEISGSDVSDFRRKYIRVGAQFSEFPSPREMTMETQVDFEVT